MAHEESPNKDVYDLADNIATSTCFDFWLRTSLMTLKRDDPKTFQKFYDFFADNPRTAGREIKTNLGKQKRTKMDDLDRLLEGWANIILKRN